ncbi:hypothetical protein [Hymenobacter koreensis]|uniref:Uncharacterized protein n=1 Tax=Hymenobacter koreensis TaxID=1084523 RepID=A0ABP8IUI4_9BACT
MDTRSLYTAAFMFFYGVICLCQGKFGQTAFWLILAVVAWAYNVRLDNGKLRADKLDLPGRTAILRQFLAAR